MQKSKAASNLLAKFCIRIWLGRLGYFEELRKPLALKSATFGIKGQTLEIVDVHLWKPISWQEHTLPLQPCNAGIQEGFMEFYPEGNNNSPEGKAL